MALSKATIGAHCREYFDLTAGEVSDSVIARWVNAGWVKIARRVTDWPQFEVTIQQPTLVGVSSYPLSLRGVETVTEPLTGGPLQRISETEAERLFVPPTNTGRPAYFSVEAGALHIWPAPDTVYALNVRGFRSPQSPNTIAVSDPIDLPNEDTEEVLVAWCLYQTALHEDDDLKAQAFRMEFAELLQTVTFDAVGASLGPMSVNSGQSVGNGLPSRLRYPFES